MLNLTIESGDLSHVAAQLALLTEQRIRQDAALALKAAVTTARDQLRSDLSDPAGPIEGGATRWTIGGTYASRFVSPQDLTASVGFASDQPHAAGRYLRPLIRGATPITKAVDIRLAGGARGLAFHPSRNLPRTAQGNISRATFGRVLTASTFTRPLRTGAIGVFQRATSKRNAGEVRFLGVLKPGRQRRRTIDLEQLLLPTIARSFQQTMLTELQRSLAKTGFA